MASLEIERICKSYGSTEVLRDITISMEHGEFLVLVGPSGCGKSTLLAMIAGLEDISDGEIRIDGQRVNEREPKERDIAMVFQSYALYPNMSVAKNIGFGMEMRGVPKAEREQKIDRAAQLLQIVPLLERKPSQLSGGQRQRVAIGRALVRDPKVFLFDEPLSNLDAKLRLEMRTEIKKLHQRLGASIVYVTHDQIEAMTLASRIVVLRDGVVQQIGTPSEIYDDPVNLFVADFMGSPAMNLIPGRLTADGATTSVALDREGEEPLTLRVDGAGKGLNTHDGREVIFGIRPEAITDAQGADRTAKHLVQTDCSVEVVEPAGADTYVVTRLAGREVIARMRSDAAVDAGSRAPFTFNMDKAVLFDPTTEQRIA